jgi:hypothetical protein
MQDPRRGTTRVVPTRDERALPPEHSLVAAVFCRLLNDSAQAQHQEAIRRFVAGNGLVWWEEALALPGFAAKMRAAIAHRQRQAGL